MAITKLNTDLNIISSLVDEPNDVGGMSAAQLKAKFDEGDNIIKNYINNTLIPFINSTKMAAEIGIAVVPGLTGITDLQSALVKIEEQMANMTQGAVADESITAAKLAADAVTAEKIADGAVIETAIADGAVTGSKVGSAAVGTANIADGAVTNAKLGNASVSTTKLGSKAVTTAKIADAAVGTTQLDSYVVTEPKLAAEAVVPRTIKAEAVTTEKIANGAVTRDKLDKDAKYSQVVWVTADGNFDPSNFGNTLANGNTAEHTVTFTKEISDAAPDYAEVAFYMHGTKKITISFEETGLYITHAGDGSKANRTIVVSEQGAMIALKKITNSTWLVTGDCEVTP